MPHDIPRSPTLHSTLDGSKKVLSRSLEKLALFGSLLLFSFAAAQSTASEWPEPNSTNKPWTRWWWHGSAVEKSELTRELESFAKAGIGGVEITPIYGVKGLESLEKEFLSPEWLDVFEHACLEAERLGMQVDFVAGTGWRFGHEDLPNSEKAVELDLITTVQGSDKTYQVEARLNDERVKRPAPGGSGDTIDMLNRDAVYNYLHRFDQRFFNAIDTSLVRASFHDSWEYETDWTRNFEEEHLNRGHLLPENAWAIFDPEQNVFSQDIIERLRYDYRMTLDDLVLDNFLDTWNQITHNRGHFTRNQAHGSIANLLDVYAKVDIPETEIFGDEEAFLMHKFSSSAAHVTNKRLVSAESYTWLAEHWTTDLAKIKRATDYLFLCGVNHVFFHGTAYSPEDAAWPGWVFYASTQLNDRNPIWNHLPALNSYIARSQNILQSGNPYADVFVYSPIADPYSEVGGTRLRQNIDGRNWFKGTSLQHSSQRLWDAGVHFDFISDRQLQQRTLSTQTTPTIVLPSFKRIPLETVKALDELAHQGVNVITLQDPSTWEVPGYDRHEERQAELEALLKESVAANRIHFGTEADVLALSADTWQSPNGFRTIRRIHEDGTHSYFIVNRSDKETTLSLPIATDLDTCLRLDPWTGETGTVALGENSKLTLSLPPYGSTFIKTGAVSEDSEPFPQAAGKDSAQITFKQKWSLSFLKGGPTLPESRKLETLVPLTELGDPQLESFAGLVGYKNEFSLSKKQANSGLTLDLGKLSSSAQVFVNDELVGTSIREPFTLSLPAELLKTGKNQLRVEVATLADNRIREMDRSEKPWRIFYDINFVNIDYKPFDASDWDVSTYGLLGPVTLKVE